MSEYAQLLMQAGTESTIFTSSEICDPNVTQVPEREGKTETFVLFEWLEERGTFSCLHTNSPNPRQETRKPDFPRFLWGKKWSETNVEEEGMKCGYLGYMCTLNNGWDLIFQSTDMCEWQAESRVIQSDEKSYLLCYFNAILCSTYWELLGTK